MKSARVVFFLLVVMLLVFAMGSCSDLFGSKDDDSSPGSLTVDGTVYPFEDLFVVSSYVGSGWYGRVWYLASSGLTFDVTPAGTPIADATDVAISGAGSVFVLSLYGEDTAIVPGTYVDYASLSSIDTAAGFFEAGGAYSSSELNDESFESNDLVWGVSDTSLLSLSRDGDSYTLSAVLDGLRWEYGDDVSAAEEVTLELDWTGPITRTYGTSLF